MSSPSNSTTTTTPKKAHQRGQSTRARRFTFSEPSAPAELAKVKETYVSNIRPQTIPNQASVQDRKCVKTHDEQRALRKGRSLPAINGRAAAKGRESQPPSNSSPRSQEISSTLSSSPSPSSSPANHSKPTRHSKHPKSSTPLKIPLSAFVPSTSTSTTSIAIPIASSPAKPTTPMMRWAGGAFENSPPPSSLPIPDFDDVDDDNNTNTNNLDNNNNNFDSSSDMNFLPLDTKPATTTTTTTIVSPSPVRRHHSTNPNQSSPPPADNQPHQRPRAGHDKQHQQQQQQQQYPSSPAHAFVPRELPPGFYSHPPSPSLYDPRPQHQPPVNRDLDQISSDLRRMLGISVST